MRLMQWIREQLGLNSVRTERADRAINMASEVATASRSLRDQLRPYSTETDPFHSMFRKRKASEEHEHRVEFEETPRAKP